MAHVHEYFKEHREMYNIMYDNIIPILESKLSSVNADEMEYIEDEMNY